MLSDDSTSDSDTGIRFKTDSTRRPTRKDDDPSKSRKSGNQRRDSSRHRDSGRNYSSRRSPPRRRDRSPLRDDKYSKDRHKSDYDIQKSFYDKDRGTKDSSSRDPNKPSSREDRPRLDDKKLYECRVSSKTIKIDDKKVDTFDSSKDRRSDLGRLSHKSSRDDRQITRNSENLNRHSSKRDKYSPNEFDENNYHGNGKIARIAEEKTKARSESPVINKRSNSRDHRNDLNEPEKRKRHDETVNNVSPVEKRLSDTSDNEHKPISYYNMISTTYDNNGENDETIAVSDSSEDEAALRKQLSLLEHELKKTKNKKKSKHRDKRKCPRSSKKSGISTDDDYKSQESNAISVEDKSNGDESNEEGEIISDSDEKSSRDDLRSRLDKQKKSNSKQELPDLRDRLSSKLNLSEQNTVGASPPQNKTEDGEEGEVEGPALPPHMLKPSNAPKNIGYHFFLSFQSSNFIFNSYYFFFQDRLCLNI